MSTKVSGFSFPYQPVDLSSLEANRERQAMLAKAFLLRAFMPQIFEMYQANLFLTLSLLASLSSSNATFVYPAREYRWEQQSTPLHQRTRQSFENAFPRANTNFAPEPPPAEEHTYRDYSYRRTNHTPPPQTEHSSYSPPPADQGPKPSSDVPTPPVEQEKSKLQAAGLAFIKQNLPEGAAKTPVAGDPYSCLGIDSSADDAAVAKAYKKLAIRVHPDKHNTEAPETVAASTEAFKLVKDSYDDIRKARKLD